MTDEKTKIIVLDTGIRGYGISTAQALAIMQNPHHSVMLMSPLSEEDLFKLLDEAQQNIYPFHIRDDEPSEVHVATHKEQRDWRPQDAFSKKLRGKNPQYRR